MEEESLLPSALRINVYKRQTIFIVLLSMLITLVMGAVIVFQKIDKLKTDLISLQTQLTREETAASNVYDKLQKNLDDAEIAQGEVEEDSKSALKSIVCSDANRYNNKAQKALKKYEKYYDNAKEYLEEYKLRYEEVNDLVKEINKIQEKLRIDKKSFTKTTLNGFTKEGQKFTELKEKDSEVRKSAKDAQDFADKLYNAYIYIMERIVAGECGSTYCPDLDQFYVMKVIENRIKHPKFPNTLEGVVFQPGQYQPTWDGNWYKKADKRTKENVRKYLRGEVDTGMPDNVVYQAVFKQGDYVWAHVSNPVDGGHYYCGIYEK